MQGIDSAQARGYEIRLFKAMNKAVNSKPEVEHPGPVYPDAGKGTTGMTGTGNDTVFFILHHTRTLTRHTCTHHGGYTVLFHFYSLVLN